MATFTYCSLGITNWFADRLLIKSIMRLLPKKDSVKSYLLGEVLVFTGKYWPKFNCEVPE